MDWFKAKFQQGLQVYIGLLSDVMGRTNGCEKP